MAISNRNFGVELETVGLDLTDSELILLKHNIPVASNPWSWSPNGKEWKVIHDASVCPMGHTESWNTAEVVSPILSGKSGLRQVEKVCEILKSNGATVNETCGLHVHVDVRDLSFEEISFIVKRYNKHEKFIDRLVAPDRRKSKNTYCQPMDRVVRDLNYVTNNFIFNEVAEYSDKYHKINIGAYCDYGTLEFRHHNGSVNPTVVKNWIRFVLNFVEQSIAFVKRKNRKGPEHYSCLETRFLQARSKGLTERSISSITGWSKRGIPQALARFARARGVTVERCGKRWVMHRRYQKTVDRGPMMGLQTYVRKYYTNRANSRSQKYSSFA